MGVQPEVHIDREQFGIAMLAGAPESVFGGKAEVGLRGRQRTVSLPLRFFFCDSVRDPTDGVELP